MVQLASLHCVFRSLRGTTECSILLDQAGRSPTLACQLFQSEQCIARLIVSGNQGHFTLSNDASADEHFLVDAMELLKIDILKGCGYSSG